MKEEVEYKKRMCFLSGTLSYAVFVYLYILYLYFLYFGVGQLGMSEIYASQQSEKKSK